MAQLFSRAFASAGILIAGACFLHCGIYCADAAPQFSAADIQFFETHIRPLFANNCYGCHGPKKQKGHLRLDSRATILAGGDAGPAVVPGKPEQSLLITAVSYTNSDLEMPPDKKLPEKDRSLLAQWVKMGAPWPNEAAPSAEKSEAAVEKAPPLTVTEKDREYWAFTPVARPQPPDVKQKSWLAQPLDRFVLAKLEAKKIKPNPPASKRELIRRAFFDLIGLPPTPQAVEAFEKDNYPDAFERVVDGLLASPQFGERWGRHWLDIVRYAQSNGYERDGEKPESWRYRDWVINSFNKDYPYNWFIIDQLAGDEQLTAQSPRKLRNELMTATGFYRMLISDDEPDDKRMAEYDELDDIMRTTGAAFLGLTVGCARCHDHKYDPIPQRDYYRMLAFFHSIKLYDSKAPEMTILQPLCEPVVAENWLKRRKQRIEDAKSAAPKYLGTFREKIRMERLASLSAEQKDALEMPKGKRTPEQEKLAKEAEKKITPSDDEIRKTLDESQKKELKRLTELPQTEEAKKPPFDWTLGVCNLEKPVETNVLIRGNASTRAERVEPGFLTVLCSPDEKTQQERSQGTGLSTTQRGRIATWIANPDNPLTARVMVNRIWQHLFSRGIVPTPDDFGKAGLPPTHPELLDWLASEFVARGWSVKSTIRTIMLSSAYRMSSRNENATALAADEPNDLFWRQNMRRIEAEALRDSILAVSGKLNPKMGGPSFYPTLSKEVLATQSRPGLDWHTSNDAEQSRRSVYCFIKRTLMVPILEVFDYTNTAAPLVSRPVTTVAPQALMLLNSEFTQQQAAALAERVKREAGADETAQIEHVFKLALQRIPTPGEMQVAQRIIKQGLKSLCVVVFNSSETMYVD